MKIGRDEVARIVIDILQAHALGLRDIDLARLARLHNPSIDRSQIAAAVVGLRRAGLIQLVRGRNWRLIGAVPARRIEQSAVSLPAGGDAGRRASPSLSEPPAVAPIILRAMPARIHRRVDTITPPLPIATQGAASGFDFLRGYMRHAAACLAEEERGAVDCFVDRAQERVGLLRPDGRWWPEQGEEIELSLPLSGLAPAMRAAFPRRDAADVALGWLLQAIDTRAGQKLVPLLTLPARFAIQGDRLVLTVEARLPDIDLSFARRLLPEQRRRLEGWLGLVEVDHDDEACSSLLDIETLTTRLASFVTSLANVTLDLLRPGEALALPARRGCHPVLALFLLEPGRFSRGAIADLRALSQWSDADLAASALGPLLMPVKPHDESAPLTEPFELTEDQLDAARAATVAPITVITGPPGTGKSQTVATILADAALHGRSALLASRNHKALDAVEERLEALAGSPLLLRLSRPGAGPPPADPMQTLEALLSRPTGSGEQARLARVVASLDRLDADRQLQMQALAELVEHGDELAEVEQALAAVVRELGPWLAARLENQPATACPFPPLPRFSRLERLPLLGRWLRWRRASTLRHLLAGVGWPESNRPRQGPNETASLLAIGAGLVRWQELRARQEKLEARLRSLPRRQERLEEVIALSRRIRAGAATACHDALREALGTVEEPAHGRLVRFRDELRLRSAAGAAAGSTMRAWREAAADLLALLPLWAVTNLSARRVLPLVPGLFDVAVIDEASQCDIASALPILARAKRAVIVGDPAQLGHVTRMSPRREVELLRQASLDLDGIGGWLFTGVSLFGLAQARASSRHLLRDHFRCHPDIADYISRAFYGGRLHVLTRSQAARPPPGMRAGLHWTDVRGEIVAAARGCHAPAEVQAVVVALQRVLVEKGWRGSIGVVTPFAEQAKRLADAIARDIPAEAIERSDLAAATAHQFQGDARDLILVSLCLGRATPAGSLAFLRQEARLLNVAVSRARAVCHVLGDLEVATSCGIPHIEMLARACQGAGARTMHARGFESPWEERLDGALRARGLQPIPQYPIAGRFLDLALVEGDVRLDVEVDGDRWHRDADGRRKADDLWRDHQLQALGWQVLRFWVYELREDIDGCVDRVLERLRPRRAG